MFPLLDEYLDPKQVLREAPGPSPWYFRKIQPRLPAGLRWKDADDGVIFLQKAGNIVLILDYYCYVLPLSADALVVWHTREEGSMNSIEFLILKINELTPIIDIPDAIKRTKADKRGFYFVDGKATSFLLPIELNAGDNRVVLPEEIEPMRELLVLGTSKTKGLCLFDLHPKERRIDVFPQNWFNEGNFDYGYQWVTRVAREPISGKIYGEGIRISSFVLDYTNRQIEKWFHDDPFHEAITKINN